MRRTQASSELTAKQRYYLTTGSTSCCSGGTGPAGPPGPPGPGVACGNIYTGVTSLNAAPVTVGPIGAYALQINGSVLYISNGVGWVNVPFTTPIYFFDTANNRMYFAESDSSPNATQVVDTGMLIGCRDRNIYNNINGTWGTCCNISPQSAYITNTPVIIDSLSSIPLITTTITQGVAGMNAQVSASIYLAGPTGNTGQGVLYMMAAGVTGTQFPYSVSPSTTETYTITQTFPNIPIGVSTVGLYGNNTGITATGAGNISVLYNLTPA